MAGVAQFCGMVSALLLSLVYGSMPGLFHNVPHVANVYAGLCR